MLTGQETRVEDDQTAVMAATAERLRAVRRAHGRFLALWAVDHLLGDAAGHMSDDLAATPDNHADGAAVKRPLFHHRPMDD